jgi:hypothetical protein
VGFTHGTGTWLHEMDPGGAGWWTGMRLFIQRTPSMIPPNG